jgi:hypothetical protein
MASRSATPSITHWQTHGCERHAANYSSRDDLDFQDFGGFRAGPVDRMPALNARFCYVWDPLFLCSSLAYGINRWILKPRVNSEFFRFWFSDLLLIPCALPVLLWLFRFFRLRAGDEAPSLFEIGWILAVWSVLFEWLAPRFLAHAVGDWRDILMYWTGGLAAWAYWRRRSMDRQV